MKEILILFGTQTGTAEDLAEELEIELNHIGLSVECSNMFDVTVDALRSSKDVYFIVSTWGEGDPPDDAEGFYKELSELEAGALRGLPFCVFGLGDTSYEYFCQFGKNLDLQMQRLGGVSLRERVDCDEDFADRFDDWAEAVVAGYQEELGSKANTGPGVNHSSITSNV